MPTYEYGCHTCGLVFEVRHKMAESPLRACPKCGARTQRLISAPHLNRGGFSSPTAAKYAKVTPAEEIAREREVQKEYQTVRLPAEVKHNPWPDQAS